MFNKPAAWKSVLVLSLVFLVIAASRITRIRTTELDISEINTVWQTLGSPLQLASSSSSDWMPGYRLLLAVWSLLVGMHPALLHVFSIFIFMLGVAFLYRVARRLFERETPAVLSALAYAALGYSVYLGVALRANGLLVALMLLALWLTMRYFDYSSTPRGLALGVCLGALFYVHSASLFVLLMLSLYTLVIYGGRVWRWGLPLAVAGLLAAPGVIAIMVMMPHSPEIIPAPVPPSSLGQSLLADYQAYTGDLFVVWGVLFVVAAVLLILRRLDRRALVLAVWILFPLVASLSIFAIPGDPMRQVAWSMIGVAMWIGFGLTMLEGRLRVFTGAGVSILFAILMFSPIRFERYHLSPSPPMVSLFEWFSTNLRPGDVVVIDPNWTQAPPEAWDYFTRAYFPAGLRFATNPGDNRRVWYIATENMRDPVVAAAVGRNRVAGAFFARADFVSRLYESPPDVPGILFANGLRYHGADVVDSHLIGDAPLVKRAGEMISLRLWWSVDDGLPEDYNMSLVIVDMASSQIVAANDSPSVTDAPTGTSFWLPGRYFLDERQLQVPDSARRGMYMIALAVSEPGQTVPIPAPGVNDQFLLPIRQFALK